MEKRNTYLFKMFHKLSLHFNHTKSPNLISLLKNTIIVFIQYTNTSHRWGGTTVHTLFSLCWFCPMSLFSITSLLCLKSCFVLSGEVTNGGINVIEQYWKLSSVAIINDFRWKQWKKEMLPTFLDFNLFVFLSVKREGRFQCIWWELKGGLCLF